MSDDPTPTTAASEAEPPVEPPIEPPIEPPAPPAEFRYTGDAGGEAHIPGIPACDLTSDDIDRLTYRRTIPEPGSPGLRRGDKGFAEARGEITKQLNDSTHYRKGRG